MNLQTEYDLRRAKRDFWPKEKDKITPLDAA
jgi:plasmid maintenance system antidote protein VapI